MSVSEAVASLFSGATAPAASATPAPVAAPASATPTPTPAPAPTVTPAPATAPPKPERPAWAYDRHWDPAKGELKGDDLRREIDGLLADKAAETSRKASLPAPEGYQLKFNPDYQLPAGFEWSWDNQDQTLAGAARQFAHKHGVSQEGFSELLGIYASKEIADAQLFRNGLAKEVEKLGVNAATRIDAVRTFLDARIGDKAGAIYNNMHTVAQVEAFETLIRNIVSQGVGGNPAGARDAAHGREPAKLSDTDYAKLTFGEKAQYAAQFDQSRFTNGRAT